jgi:hypothetical protein
MYEIAGGYRYFRGYFLAVFSLIFKPNIPGFPKGSHAWKNEFFHLC